jgi:Ni/Fe-hydrogenase subunit HybB-like protein
MVLLGDEAQVEAHFYMFGDSANLDARYVHYVRRTYHSLRNHFRHTRSNFYVTWVMWIIVLVRLDMELESGQDRCTVRVKHTMRLEIVLDTPDGTPR